MASTIGWDRSSVYSASVLPGETLPDALHEIENNFCEFIEEFRLENAYIYRDQLRENILVKRFFIEVNMEHLINFNEELAHKLASEPAEHIIVFEKAVQKVAKRMHLMDLNSTFETTCQVMLYSDAHAVPIRDLNAKYICKLVRLTGIIIGASVLSSKASRLTIMCKSCRDYKHVDVGQGLSGLDMPRKCQRPKQMTDNQVNCPLDPYIIVHEQSTFIDQQILKLQEAPDMVPVGDLPRHVMMSADRALTNKEEEFRQLSRNPRLYEIFSSSIAPSIYGSYDIKKAIACLLFGGSKKVLPDGMRLRGDINVLLLGDPGTAKSQLLKFVEKVAPIAVYTSGKGSSAAGLTASVQRDSHTREFYLEGGAMVLAGGGVVCIDEFDKMRDEDRVAIHEAMEQQTISIAKAGITTILNSRTSVLAAANPIYGRYDELKSPGENIDFQTTILSRFDMIFIVKDEHDEARDKKIADHVINIHMHRSAPELESNGEISIEKMKRYIAFVKSKCAPRLSESAAEKLSSHFVAIRKKVQLAEQHNKERSTIPITIRQLEAIVRISESLAKMCLRIVVSEEDVDEAIRLFQASTMDAALQSGNAVNEEMKTIEETLSRKMPLGFSVPMRTAIRDFVHQKRMSQQSLDRALHIMVARGTIQLRHNNTQIYRSGL